MPYTLTPAPPHSPQITTINPFGKIPVARHGDCELFESLAIIIYADRAYPGAKLIPEEPVPASGIFQWASAISTSVFPSLVGYMQAHAFPQGSDGKPDGEAIRSALPGLHRQIQILDRAVQPTGHLTGESFTLADMYLMPILAYLHAFPESGAALAAATHLRSYFETHARRRSFLATTPPPLAALRA